MSDFKAKMHKIFLASDPSQTPMRELTGTEPLVRGRSPPEAENLLASECAR